MAKEVTFIMEEPPSADLAVRWWSFLVKATEKREQVTTVGTLRKIDQEEVSA